MTTLAVASVLALLGGCGGSSGGGSTGSGSTGGGSTGGGSTGGGSTGGGSTTISSCPDHITSGASMGITALPASSANTYKTNFCKYTQLTAPNGKPIRFFAQNKITNEQLVRARNILTFYLTDVEGSQYGANKTAVYNKMADNNATLILLNGSDDGNPPANGQTLYETENVVEGTAAYLVNEPRDAAFEEILHLMHDTGIGVDGANTTPGVPELAPYQQSIRVAMENAIPSGVITSNGAQLGIWASGAINWLKELAPENSLTQEYLASIIDTYYGLAGKSSSGGSNDLYQPQTRAEIATKDPMGWALVGADSPRKFFSEYVTYEARVDAQFEGTFSLTFDSNKQYTHKSQYLLNALLTGTKPTNLVGNAQNNRLTGNEANNELTGGTGDDRIDGGAGTDTVNFTGVAADYDVSTSGDTTTVTDKVANRDGTDTIVNAELLKFSDTMVVPGNSQASVCNPGSLPVSQSLSYFFDGNFSANFIDSSRWPSENASFTQSASQGVLTANSSDTSQALEAWKLFQSQMPYNKSWEVSLNVTVPLYWNSNGGANAQVGAGIYVGRPTTSGPAPKVYETNMAAINGNGRFVQAQLIANRLGEDPIDVQRTVLDNSKEFSKLTVCFSHNDHALSFYIDGTKVGASQAIDASGLDNWGLTDSDKIDIGIMGFAENTVITENSPTVDNFEVRVY